MATSGARPSPEPIFFIEPYAHQRNGHSQAALVALSAAATAEGLEAFVVALSQPLPPDIRAALSAAGATIVDRASLRGRSSRALRSGEALLRRVVAWEARADAAETSWPYQTRLFARALAEAAGVRAARSLRRNGTIVILTASELLIGFSCYLAGHRHIRIVHSAHHREGRLVRATERLCAGGRARSAVWCPTAGVAAEVRRRYPDIAPEVRPFAVVEPGQRITERERAAARQRLGLAADEVVAVVIGGWQSYKDPLTAMEGLSGARTRLTVIVAGSPIDVDSALRYRTSSCRVLPFAGPLEPAAMRSLYAAATFSVVSRVAGFVTESGLVMDAAKLGVPLVMSDNDPDLVRRLAGAPWAAVFRAGDSSSLARTVDGLELPPPRPPDTAPALLGMLTSTQMVRAFRQPT